MAILVFLTVVALTLGMVYMGLNQREESKGFTPQKKGAEKNLDGLDINDRKQVQKYLMERWEQSLEEACFAHIHRQTYEQNTRYLTKLETEVQEARQTMRQFRDKVRAAGVLRSRADEPYYQSLERREFGVTSDEVEKNYVTLRVEFTNTKNAAHEAWCDAMQLPKGTAMHQYLFPPLWGLTREAKPAMLDTGREILSHERGECNQLPMKVGVSEPHGVRSVSKGVKSHPYGYIDVDAILASYVDHSRL